MPKDTGDYKTRWGDNHITSSSRRNGSSNGFRHKSHNNGTYSREYVSGYQEGHRDGQRDNRIENWRRSTGSNASSSGQHHNQSMAAMRVPRVPSTGLRRNNASSSGSTIIAPSSSASRVSSGNDRSGRSGTPVVSVRIVERSYEVSHSYESRSGYGYSTRRADRDCGHSSRSGCSSRR